MMTEATVPTKDELVALLREGRTGEFNQTRLFPTADLTGANLGEADLTGANLGGANLGVADLTGANLGEADLTGANLWGCRGLSEERQLLFLEQLKKSWE